MQACREGGLAAHPTTGLVTGKERWFLGLAQDCALPLQYAVRTLTGPRRRPWATEEEVNAHVRLQVRGTEKRFVSFPLYVGDLGSSFDLN